MTSITVSENNEVFDSRDNCNAIIEEGVLEYRLILGCKSSIIPEGVEIVSDAFEGNTDLTSITIPGNVICAYNSFSGCTNLTSISISKDNQVFDSTGLTSVTVSDGVTSIGRSAFEHCTDLVSITHPNSITKIECSTFSGCSKLASITIPDEVTDIERSAFWECVGLTSITVPDSVKK